MLASTTIQPFIGGRSCRTGACQARPAACPAVRDRCGQEGHPRRPRRPYSRRAGRPGRRTSSSRPARPLLQGCPAARMSSSRIASPPSYATLAALHRHGTGGRTGRDSPAQRLPGGKAECPDMRDDSYRPPAGSENAYRRISLARRQAARTTSRDGRTVVPRAGSPNRNGCQSCRGYVAKVRIAAISGASVVNRLISWDLPLPGRADHVQTWLDRHAGPRPFGIATVGYPVVDAVSYTHLTLPTNREV